MRVPSMLRICSTRYPCRSLPNSTTSKATSKVLSSTPTRRNVACGSAVIQWTVSANAAFSPVLPAVALIVACASVLDLRGNVLLMAQNPANKHGPENQGIVQI